MDSIIKGVGTVHDQSVFFLEEMIQGRKPHEVNVAMGGTMGPMT